MMHQKIYTPKVIADPIYGIVDIRPVLPMTKTREFQALGDKRQLGTSYLVFPSATHTRMAHSLGVYHATAELSLKWFRLGLINEKERYALPAYGLYHDIGHPAFSHVTEDLCERDNDGTGMEIANRMKEVVEKSGIDFKLFRELSCHENPLSLAVRDKNLGMDKLDYLERDGLYTILAKPAGIDYLRKHIYFIDGQIMIDKKVIDNALEVQNFYIKMYKNVYLRKSTIITQRMVQKIAYRMIASGEILSDDLPKLTDSELVGLMRISKDEIAKELYGRLRERQLFREAIVIRPEQFSENHYAEEKPVSAFGIGNSQMDALISAPEFKSKNQKSIEEFEKKIADLSGIPESEIMIVTVFGAWRFTPQDITAYNESRSPISLKERYPAHFKSLEETARSYVAFRICTTEENREKLSEAKTSQKIYDLILGAI